MKTKSIITSAALSLMAITFLMPSLSNAGAATSYSCMTSDKQTRFTVEIGGSGGFTADPETGGDYTETRVQLDSGKSIEMKTINSSISHFTTDGMPQNIFLAGLLDISEFNPKANDASMSFTWKAVEDATATLTGTCDVLY